MGEPPPPSPRGSATFFFAAATAAATVGQARHIDRSLSHIGCGFAVTERQPESHIIRAAARRDVFDEYISRADTRESLERRLNGASRSRCTECRCRVPVVGQGKGAGHGVRRVPAHDLDFVVVTAFGGGCKR